METDNFKIIYNILSALNKAMDVPDFDAKQISAERLGITEARWQRIIEMLLDSGYIKGVSITQDMVGTNINCKNIRITLKGLEYLSENSIMQRMYKIARGIVDFIPGM